MLALLALLALTSPQHWRFMQPNLSRGGSGACVDTLGGGQFKSADWEVRGLGAAAPTLTESYEAGPTGSCVRATRVQTAATVGGQFSAVFNDNGVTATDFCPQTGGGNISFGCWVKAASAVTFDFAAYDHVNDSWRNTALNATTSWQWLKVEAVAWADCTAGDCQFLIGGATLINGAVVRDALDLRISNCRCVAGNTISP